MRTSKAASHDPRQQILFTVVICGFLDLWVAIAAEPVGRSQAENPVTSFPGKATWGYSSDVSGPISISGASESAGRSFDDAPSGATIRGGTTYGTTLGRWIGKATPIVKTTSTRVVSSAVSVVGEEPGSGTDIPYGTATRKPPPLRPPTRKPPPPTLPPTRFIPFDLGRRRLYPYLPHTPFFFPLVDSHFHGGGIPVGPLNLVYGRLQSDPAHVHPQSQSAETNKLSSDEDLETTGHKESHGNLLSESLPLENGEKLQKLGSADNMSAALREQNISQDNDSVSQDPTGVSGRNLELEEDMLNDGTASSNDLFLSDEFSTTDEMDETDMTSSREQVHSVHERNAENEYILLDQTTSYTDDDTRTGFGSYDTTASLTHTGLLNQGSRPDQMVMASIFLKPASGGGSILPYFEEDDKSSYPSSQSASPGSSVNLFAAGFGSNPTSRQPIPRYIIVKDQSLGRVSIPGSDHHEASSGGSGASPSRNESSISKVLDTTDANGDNVTEGDRKEFDSPSGCIREDVASRAVVPKAHFGLGDSLAILLVMLFLKFLLPE